MQYFRKGYILPLIIVLMVAIGLLGIITYLKFFQPLKSSMQEQRKVEVKNSKWKLINHSKEVSFRNEFKGEKVYSGREFLDIKFNGNYWLLGRGDSNSSLDHFYKYDSKGFTNLSQQFVDINEIWHIAWNNDYWLLGNSNYVFTKSQLARYDGKNFLDLTDQFRKTPCPSTYEGHINISKIFASKSVFLIVSNTDLNSCYALYDGSKFQDISESFPVHPKNSGLEGQRILYNNGDCYNQVCYLTSEGGSNHIVKFDVKLNRLEQISINDLTNGSIKDALVRQIKVNNNGEWIFQLTSSDFKNNSSKLIFLSYDSSGRSSKVIYQKDGKFVGQESLTLEGWDSTVSKWVIMTSKCSGKDKQACNSSINHLEGDKLSKIPVDLPESSDVPRIGISPGDYLISYQDQLLEAKLNK